MQYATVQVLESNCGSQKVA